MHVEPDGMDQFLFFPLKLLFRLDTLSRTAFNLFFTLLLVGSMLPDVFVFPLRAPFSELLLLGVGERWWIPLVRLQAFTTAWMLSATQLYLVIGYKIV